MIKKVISGGQTGADLAGLFAAKANLIDTGGWIPYNYQTELGHRSEYKYIFNLKPTKQADYNTRTKLNIQDSDATLIFVGSDNLTGGSLLTVNLCKKLKKPFKVIYLIREYKRLAHNEIMNFLETNDIEILNIAGNRQSKSPGIFEKTFDILNEIFSVYKK